MDGRVRGLMHGSVPRESAEVTTYLSQFLTDIRTSTLQIYVRRVTGIASARFRVVVVFIFILILSVKNFFNTDSTNVKLVRYDKFLYHHHICNF